MYTPYSPSVLADKDIPNLTKELKTYLQEHFPDYAEVVVDLLIVNAIDWENMPITYIVILLPQKTDSYNSEQLTAYIHEKIRPLNQKIRDFFWEKELDVVYYTRYASESSLVRSKK